MLQLRNCTVCAVNAGSGTAYSLYNTTGGTLGIGATSYTGTTYGTITDYSQVGSQAALVANNLDHLCLTETAAADMTAEVADNTILSRILAAGDTSAFVPTTDGLQPIRDNVGTAGAGLTAVVWNATWDAEVQSEVNDALVALDLDHLLKVACDTSDITSNVVNYSVMAFAVADNGVIANFDPTTDSLDAIYDRILAVEVDTQDLQTQIGTDGAGLTDLGGMSTAMKAAVNAEVVDVLRTDTVTQIAAVPAANAALHTMIQYVYAAARNKRLTTSTTDVIRNDGDTGAIGTSTIADDGSTFTRGKYT